MKRKVFIVFVGLLSLLSCSEKKLPNYPAKDDGITRKRLDSATFFTQRHDTRNAMYQLKAAEKHLFNVNTDTLKFTTYYHIALLNEQNGAYKLALNYFNHAAKYANDSKRSHRLADIFLGKASVFNQMGMLDSALQNHSNLASEKTKKRASKTYVHE